MIGMPVFSAAVTNPPRPNRCSLYRCEYGLPTPLNPSGNTDTSSPVDSNRSASGLQASVFPALRLIGPRNGVWKIRSAPSIRSGRFIGWCSRTATAVISASTAMVPEWLATNSAPPVSGMFSMPMVSIRNHFSYSTFNGGTMTLSVKSGS